MMVGKDDHLGLSLSLSFASSSSASAADHHHRLPLQLNLMPSPSPFFLPQKAATPWTDLLAPPPPAPGERGLRGIDVNRAPAGERESEEDGGGASSPNSTLSSVSGKRGRSSERDLDPAAPAGSDDHDHEADRACSSRGGGIASDEEDGGDGSRKKLRLSKDQSAILEESFKEHNTLNPKQKLALAKQLNLRPRQVEVWFQNRRARTKLKQTEVDCEFLKRCCENLTEENRRLQKEVQELRALKLSPQFYMHMTPPTTLTMCPSCERVSSSCTAAAAPQPNAAPATPSVVAPADFLYSHHHQQQHRKVGQAAAAPWAPVPLRAVPFLDAAAAAAAQR